MDCESICNMGDRLKLSDNQVTAIVTSVLKAGGADLDDFVISRLSSRRQRMAIRCQINENQMSAFRENPPKYGALHWDGKMFKECMGIPQGTSVEALAVLVSGTGDYREGKLLGVPFLKDSSGASQANASYNLLASWEIRENITALVFDTTASNSGVYKGAAKLIESMLDRKLFYLACRHHILEIIIGSVWEQLFGKVKSPDNPWFKALRDVWPKINKDTTTKLNVHFEGFNLLKMKSLENLRSILIDSKQNIRADYREVAELTMILLGERPPRGTHWCKPGAIHQARWMARNLYSMKMLMFSDQLNYDQDMVSKLVRLNTFLSLFYAPIWMTSTYTADAPINDLSFIQDMIRYKSIDPEIASIVLKKIQNHRWYLTEEVVPFSLFSTDKRVTIPMKRKIADQIHKTERPEAFRRGKPVFQSINMNTNLSDLVGPESYFLFDVLSIDANWLAKPVDTWPLCTDYLVAQSYVHSLKVVNDVAERGIKMMTDFANIITTDRQQRQYLLQAVEYNRTRFDSFKKSSLNQ